jgi:tetratricopeptide (TPR) repeat protein
VKQVFTEIRPIYNALKQAAEDCDRNTLSMSFSKKSNESSDENLDHLDQYFMYTQILKEILLIIDFKQTHIDEFLTYCREQLVDNTIELNNVEKLQNEYHHHKPIWWYTYPCSFCSMLNRALRLMEIDLIIKLGFFIRDLHQNIAALHVEQIDKYKQSDPFTVYRGQGLSQVDFDQLMTTKGGLMSFNNFLSTSLDEAVSLAFAESNQNSSDLLGVLFEITIDPSICSSPFANIGNVSYYQKEKEILFSMHSVFRIGQIEQINRNNRLWRVKLTLTSNNDSQYLSLTESIRKEIKGSSGWFQLGQFMVTLGHYDKAEELYQILLKQANTESKKAHIFNYLGRIKEQQGMYMESLVYHEKVIEICRTILPPDHLDLAASYNNVGLVYDNMGEYSQALFSHKKALEIKQKTLSPNHSDLASTCNNIGSVYFKMGKYSKALLYYEKALDIVQENFPANHPHLATSYSNIGLVYNMMGEYGKALSYCEKDLDICQKTLPENHPSLAISYNNIGLVSYNMSDYSKASTYHNKALEICQRALPAHHPHLATTYSNIGSVNEKTGKYSEALTYYKRALDILKYSLAPNHPHWATSYSNIGSVYYNMSNYAKALTYYERAMDIFQRSLPSDHPQLQNIQNIIQILELKL